jgi:hypothetical protein
MQAIINPVIDKPKRYQCRHIFTDGHRCGSPCLRGEELCYYHHTTRKPTTGARRRRCRRSAFDLPLPEDRSAIQSSIGQVLQRIASNDIDPRRAGLLLYGLQIASLNLPRDLAPSRSAEAETVEEIILDPALGTLAPRSEAGQEALRRSPVAALFDRLGQLGITEEGSLNASESFQAAASPTEDQAEDKDQAEHQILPILHAAAGELTHATPHHRKRGQIFIFHIFAKRKFLVAIPGNLSELVRSPQRSPTELRSRLRRKARRRLLQQRNQTLHTEVSSSMPSLHHTLGHHQQLRPRLKRLHQRLMRQVRKQTQRYRSAVQNPRTLRVMKHSRHATRVHISKNPQRKIVATNKCWCEADSMRSPEQFMIDRLDQERSRIHHIGALRPQQLRALATKRILNLSGNRLRLLFGPGNIGQQKDHMRTKVDRIKKISTRPHRVILSMQIKTFQLFQLHTTRSSTDRRRPHFRRHNGMLQPTNLFAIVTPPVTDRPSECRLQVKGPHRFERISSIAEKGSQQTTSPIYFA